MRRQVLRRLAQCRSGRLPGFLHERSLVRQQAIVALGRLREPEAAADLLALLDDADPRLRFASVRALGQIRNPEVPEGISGSALPAGEADRAGGPNEKLEKRVEELESRLRKLTDRLETIERRQDDD